jgi:hypothetical protein
MRRTETFRHQHVAILQVMAEISALLDVDTLSARGDECRGLLSKLAGQLTVHLSMEDSGLYPKLEGHQSLEVRTLAQRYRREMGGIADAFAAYMQRWRTSQAIVADRAGFILDTRELFQALARRISREDSELYTLVDNA